MPQIVGCSYGDGIDPDFFFRLLGSDSVYAAFSRLAAGATVKNLNIDLVKGVTVKYAAQDRAGHGPTAATRESSPMKATEAKLLAFLKKSPQFVIPIYQRTYSWTERECRQLWDDVVRAGSNPAVTGHFVGSIVYIEQGLFQVGAIGLMLSWTQSAASQIDWAVSVPGLHCLSVLMRPRDRSELENKCSATPLSISGRPS